MNRPLAVLLGAMATVIASLIGLVWAPNWQVRQMEPLELTNAQGITAMYPAALSDYDEAPGRVIYQNQGCIYCHSQQVRPESFGADIQRGWGQRRSVPLDYRLNSPPLLGTMRTGPDLANIGTRQPADAWHHLHLFDARLVSPGSVMPPFTYLYRVVEEDPKDHGYRLPDSYFHKAAWIVPQPEARNLVAYLKTLHQDYSVEEVQ